MTTRQIHPPYKALMSFELANKMSLWGNMIGEALNWLLKCQWPWTHCHYLIVSNVCQGKYWRILKTHLVILGTWATYLLKTPPSNDAFRHSGGESLLWTSATVTLYLEVELRSESRPGTEQKTSLGDVTVSTSPSLPLSFFGRIPDEQKENIRCPKSYYWTPCHV